MRPGDFLTVRYNSHCLVGNSSAGIRECSFLPVPSVNLGNRQDGRERGPNVLDVAHDRTETLGAIWQRLQTARPSPDTIYGDAKAGPRIAERLAPWTPKIEKRLAY
jgi:UDP-N-acetylglucosamine 2-epimerase